MKVTITLKDPDRIPDAIDAAVRADIASLNLAPDEAEALYVLRREKVDAELGAWIKWGEYIWVEFDTTAKVARVLTSKECE